MSSFFVDGVTYYIKHLCGRDQYYLDNKHNEYLAAAVSKGGLPLEKDKLNILVNDGVWSLSDEDWINTQKNFIQKLKQNKSHILDSSASAMDEEINRAQRELAERMEKRNSLFGVTAENWADRKVNEYYLLHTLYSDSALTTKAFTEDDYDISNEILDSFITAINRINDKSIKKLACSTFFQHLFDLSDSAFEFYGKPVSQLTFYQINLFKLGTDYKNIYSQGFPPKEITDPDEIIKWYKNKDKAPPGQFIENIPPINQEEVLKPGQVAKGKQANRLAKQLLGN